MSSSISPAELDQRRLAGEPLELIDVRTPVEYREVHVQYARNVPLDRLDTQAIVAQRKPGDTAPLYVVCRTGKRSQQACDLLKAAGHSNAVNVDGGTVACAAAGLPLVKGQKALSLDRQVRIAAGALIVTSAVLGFWVHPYFIGLAAFVGAGLMFAGLTDTCGMGMLLARMPWNQVTDATKGAQQVGALLLIALLAAATPASAEEKHTPDTLETVKQSVADRKAILVDVREKREWDSGHLRDARFLPLSVLQQGVREEDLARTLTKDKVIYLHCAAGARCLQAATILKKQGYDVRALKPGYNALVEAGFPAAAER